MRTLKNKLRDSLNCCDCGFFELYMVRDEVWAAAGLHWSARCCMACLERRLGRLLTIGDFTVCPVNRMAYAAVGQISVVVKDDEREEKARRSREEQARQLPFDSPDDDEQAWECIWSPS
jgi:hypothetical protein